MGGRAWLAYVLALAATASAASLVAQESADPELSAATSLLDGRRFDDARKAFERLSDTRGSACSECLLGLAEADLRLGKGKDAIKLCDRTLRAGIADAKLRARAHNIKALALVQEGHNSEKALKAAEEELTRALEAAPDGADIRFNRGRLLLRQGRDAEGTADLRRYLELSPTGPTAERARRLIQDPRRARERFAPDFSLVTLQGETLDMERLKGRIVLIDFWATWCGPCRAAIPEIKRLLRKYPGERLLVLSISGDQDERAWREFVAKNGMTWPQYFDGSGTMCGRFGVHSFPTYLLLDADGIVRSELRGTDPRRSVASRLDSALERFPELRVPR